MSELYVQKREDGIRWSQEEIFQSLVKNLVSNYTLSLLLGTISHSLRIDSTTGLPIQPVLAYQSLCPEVYLYSESRPLTREQLGCSSLRFVIAMLSLQDTLLMKYWSAAWYMQPL